MTNKFVFLNYGMRDSYRHEWSSDNKEDAKQLIEKCKEKYIFFDRLKNNPTFYSTLEFSIQGINLTVHSMGVHRALSCEIPDSPPPSEETTKLFEAIKADAMKIVDRDYDWRKNNCVMAVAEVLNTLDPGIIPKGVNMPWEIDTAISRYCGWYPEGTTEGKFIRQYQQIVNDTGKSSPYWSVNKNRRIDSMRDILVNAESESKGDITRATLFTLGWVKKRKNGFMEPGQNAPDDFKNALNAYNVDRKNVLRAKMVMEQYDPWGSLSSRVFTRNIPFELAQEQLQALSAKNPKGAAAKTLVEPEEESQHSNASICKSVREQVQSLRARNPDNTETATNDETEPARVTPNQPL